MSNTKEPESEAAESLESKRETEEQLRSQSRIRKGFIWGMVATVAMTITHIVIWAVTGRLTVVALATRTLPGTVVAKILGPELPTSTHLLLAALLHLGYGGVWGAILFALIPRVTFWHGVAMGVFLYLGLEIFLLPILGRGVFASEAPDRTFLVFFSVATHFTYGGTLGFLGWAADRPPTALAPVRMRSQPAGVARRG